MTLEELLNLLRALNEQSVEYALVGGAAMNLHGVVRATEDIDLFVRPSPRTFAEFDQPCMLSGAMTTSI
jgi:hypothetical protein